MAWLAGLFLIAHAVVDLAIWATPATTAQPFDPCRSWLTTPLAVEDRAHAVATAATFARRRSHLTIDGLGAMPDAEWSPGKPSSVPPVAAADRRLFPPLADGMSSSTS